MAINSEKIVELKLDGSDMIYDCQFHPENYDQIGFSTLEGDIKLIDFKNVRKPNTVLTLKKYHKGNPIRKIRFKDNLLFSVSKSLKLTDLSNQKLIKKISNGQTPIYSIVIIDEYLVGIGDDRGTFKVWDYRTDDKPVHMVLHECENYISDLDVDSDQQIIVSSSGEGTLTAYNIRSKKMEEPQSELFDSGFQCVRYAEDKNKVLVGSEDGVINIFNKNEWGNISDRYPIKKNNMGSSSIECLEILNEDENCFVFGSSDGCLEIVSLFPHRHLKTLARNDDSIQSVDVNQITSRIVGINENLIQLFSYEITNEISKKTKKFRKNNDHNNKFFSDLITE